MGFFSAVLVPFGFFDVFFHHYHAAVGGVCVIRVCTMSHKKACGREGREKARGGRLSVAPRNKPWYNRLDIM